MTSPYRAHQVVCPDPACDRKMWRPGVRSHLIHRHGWTAREARELDVRGLPDADVSPAAGAPDPPAVHAPSISDRLRSLIEGDADE